MTDPFAEHEAARALEVDWAFICDYALIDVNGKVSILGLFDRVFAAQYPSLHPSLYLAVGWIGSPKESASVELRLWSPAKEMLATASQQITTGPDGRTTGIMLLSPIPLPAPGEYIFELMADLHSKKHLTLTVTTPPQ